MHKTFNLIIHYKIKIINLIKVKITSNNRKNKNILIMKKNIVKNNTLWKNKRVKKIYKKIIIRWEMKNMKIIKKISKNMRKIYRKINKHIK